jgi:hypothetical protein
MTDEPPAAAASEHKSQFLASMGSADEQTPSALLRPVLARFGVRNRHRSSACVPRRSSRSPFTGSPSEAVFRSGSRPGRGAAEPRPSGTLPLWLSGGFVRYENPARGVLLPPGGFSRAPHSSGGRRRDLQTSRHIGLLGPDRSATRDARRRDSPSNRLQTTLPRCGLSSCDRRHRYGSSTPSFFGSKPAAYVR